MLKKITKWETEDGKVFDTQEDAEDYMFEQDKEVMTHHTEAERVQQVRHEFEAWCRRRGIDVSTKKDAWGREYYSHAPVSFAWLVWEEQEEAHLAMAARRAPAAPVPQGWIDPNDKAQKQYLPHIGERVLFKHDGRVYLGKHTGGSFKAEYPFGKTFGTWDCKWMYPSALDAAAPQPPEAGCSVSNGETQAAPVQLPEYGIDTANHAGIRVRGYTEQQVIDLLKSVGVSVKEE